MAMPLHPKSTPRNLNVYSGPVPRITSLPKRSPRESQATVFRRFDPTNLSTLDLEELSWSPARC